MSTGQKHNADQHARKFLDLMPRGYLMKDKYDSTTNHYKWWKAVAMYFVLIESDWSKVIDELGVETTETLITRWESEFGLPDETIDIAGTLAERRNNILLKKSGLNLIGIDEFQDIADRLDFDVTFYNMENYRFPPYDVPFIPQSALTSKFMVAIEADYSDTDIAGIIDFFTKLLPINVGVLEIDTSVVYDEHLPYSIPHSM
jgi:uncharacterized protein YmfQ (DUF2313 family)